MVKSPTSPTSLEVDVVFDYLCINKTMLEGTVDSNQHLIIDNN